MKTKLLLLLVLFSLNIIAQDQLFKKDNSKHSVKILEVTPTEIKYKSQTNIDGPIYIINKNDVALIIYANGDHETFADVTPKTQTIYIQPSQYTLLDSFRIQKKREKEEQFLVLAKKKNVVFLNALGFLNSCVSFSYLREFGKGLFSVQIPLSFSYDKPGTNLFTTNNYYYNVNSFNITQKSFDGGLGVYIHTSGKKAVTHFIGPLFKFAQYNGNYTLNNGYYYDPNTGNNYYNQTSTYGFVLNETSVYINNGVLFRITPHFNLMVNAAVGFITNRTFIANDPKNIVPNYYGYNSYSSFSIYGNPTFNLGFSAGYRF